MKNIYLFLLAVFLLSACAPSVETIQTAIAETQSVWTPIPTQTAYPTYTPYPTLTFTPEPTATPDNQVLLSNVINAFKNAGLEAEGVFIMGAQDYGAAPFICTGARFLVPSLGEGKGGRAFVCNTQQEVTQLSNYYTELGRSSAILFSWVFVKGNVLVQINGDLPEATARQYEAALP